VRKIALIGAVGAAVFAGSLWLPRARESGTLELDFRNDEVAVLVYAKGFPLDRCTIFEPDRRPELSGWGYDPDEVRSRRCVFFGELKSARRVLLPPGEYVVFAHGKSPCGYYGGTRAFAVEVKAGEHVCVPIVGRAEP
jgi:hypothetical protein